MLSMSAKSVITAGSGPLDKTISASTATTIRSSGSTFANVGMELRLLFNVSHDCGKSKFVPNASVSLEKVESCFLVIVTVFTDKVRSD